MEKILEILKEDSRVTPKEIAIMLGLTEAEVVAKIKELEDDNVILKYTTIINEEKTTKDSVQAFIEARVSPEREMGFDAIAERIHNFPQVKSLFLISGGFDFLIAVEGADLKEVAMFVSEKLSTLPFIVSISTHFMLKKYKENGIKMDDEKDIDERIAVMP